MRPESETTAYLKHLNVTGNTRTKDKSFDPIAVQNPTTTPGVTGERFPNAESVFGRLGPRPGSR